MLHVSQPIRRLFKSFPSFPVEPANANKQLATIGWILRNVSSQVKRNKRPSGPRPLRILASASTSKASAPQGAKGSCYKPEPTHNKPTNGQTPLTNIHQCPNFSILRVRNCNLPCAILKIDKGWQRSHDLSPSSGKFEHLGSDQSRVKSKEVQGMVKQQNANPETWFSNLPYPKSTRKQRMPSVELLSSAEETIVDFCNRSL